MFGLPYELGFIRAMRVLRSCAPHGGQTFSDLASVFHCTIQPGFRVSPMPGSSCPGNAEDGSGLVQREPGKIAQLTSSALTSFSAASLASASSRTRSRMEGTSPAVQT